MLHATPFARAVVSVIEEENTHALVHDEGAYLRVLVPLVCRLSRAGLEAATGFAIRFPGDLEVVLSSFTGVMLRRVQRIAYRTVQLGGPPSETEAARRQQAAWEHAAAFQPLRELLERALIAYDWGEAFTVTNLVIKPRIDRLVNQEIAGTLAAANGDPPLASIHFSLDEDARWHRAWTAALLRHLIDDTPANAEVVSGWIQKWSPLASRAVEAFAEILAEAPVPLDAHAAGVRIGNEVSRETGSMLTAPPPSAGP